jgi:DNA-directed RNA polymerase specialized sigma24 family protein
MFGPARRSRGVTAGALVISEYSAQPMDTDHEGAPMVDWDAAVRAHNARVVASVLALAVPLDQAEELASQAWTRLIEQQQAGRLARVELPGLAIKQARFLALSWLKARRRDAALPEDVAADDDLERALIARRDVETALRVLATCSASAQAVFAHLYDDPPPSHEVVAGRVGLSVQRVRQIVCEVRKKIRETLEPRP